MAIFQFANCLFTRPGNQQWLAQNHGSFWTNMGGPRRERPSCHGECNHPIWGYGWPGWWYTYPSEKYEFVSWDDSSQYMEEKKKQCSKPPTSDKIWDACVGFPICRRFSVGQWLVGCFKQGDPISGYPQVQTNGCVNPSTTLSAGLCPIIKWINKMV